MDLSLQPARPHSQTLMLGNHLIIRTAEFLNKFANECDAKLCKLHQKMQRLEVEVKLLEFKLGSIPGMRSKHTARGVSVRHCRLVCAHAGLDDAPLGITESATAPPPAGGECALPLLLCLHFFVFLPLLLLLPLPK